MHYRADITAGALKVPESRRIADLLLRGADAAAWQKALYQQNILQTRRPETTRRLARLIRERLLSMDAGLWTLVRDDSTTVATHACLAAAVKHSALLGDFLDLVVREHCRRFVVTLSAQTWEAYLEACRGRDPAMPRWRDSTIARLRSTVFQVLAQAGYIENTHCLKLQSVHLASPVIEYLQNHHENYVLRCLQVAP